MNKVAVNILVQVFCEYMQSFFLDIHLEVGLLDQKIGIYLALLETVQKIPKVTILLCIPTDKHV